MWQVWLLSLLATTHAVMVHQSPIYGSHENNKLTPQTTFRTALNHQNSYIVPQNNYNPPQSTYNQPQSTYNQPQSTYNQPQNLYNQPQNLYNKPLNNYNQPQNNFNQPQSTYNQPQQLLSHAQPLINHLQETLPQKEDYYDEPSYTFNYEIHDESTGDDKTHTETRQGDVVQGSYSLIEPDGSRRIVDYIADKIGGFRAQVRREHGAAKPIVSSAKLPGYQPVNPVVQTYVPRYTQPEKYQNGPVTFSPAKPANSPLQSAPVAKPAYSPLLPAPVTEQSKYAAVAAKPPIAYSPVVYASESKSVEKSQKAPSTYTNNPNQIAYNPVQYA